MAKKQKTSEEYEQKIKELEKKLQTYKELLNKKTKKEREAFIKYTKENPEKALLMAFLIGLLIGMIRR